MLTSAKTPHDAAPLSAANSKLGGSVASSPFMMPYTTVEVITPDIAKDWLKLNIKNRLPSRSNIKKYSADMIAGRWCLTGDAVRFDSDGRLLDGQHRLLACIDGGVPFQSYVIRGLPPEAKVHMDLGMKRTSGMILQQLGHSYTNQIAAVVVNLMTLKNLQQDHRGRHSTPEIVEFVRRHPQIEDALAAIYGKHEAGTGTPSKRRVSAPALGPSPGVLGAVYYAAAFLCHDQKERADAFLTVFKTGAPDYPNDPSHMWRERLIRERTRGLHLSREQQLRGTCHAWNLFRDRLGVGKFRIPDEAIIDGLNTDRI